MTRARPTTDTVTLHVPFRIVKRGGRKEMLLPPETASARTRTDDTLVKALARAFRWKRMLDSKEFVTVAELAEREGIADNMRALLDRHPKSRIEELMPWQFRTTSSLAA